MSKSTALVFHTIMFLFWVDFWLCLHYITHPIHIAPTCIEGHMEGGWFNFRPRVTAAYHKCIVSYIYLNPQKVPN